jgi:Fe-S-cluster-containing dehydrogenase component/DMSO reductase anchor subunit
MTSMHPTKQSNVTEAGSPLCHDPDHTPRWGMIVDVNRCVGCQTCTIACKHWNNTLPDVQWRRVIDIEEGEFPDVQRHFLVVGCQHCAEPPCVPVCPTGATRQRADGLVTMDYELCIGCAYCAVACPYQARTIAHEVEGYYTNEITQQEEQVFDTDRVGVAQKCTFCMDRIDDGLAQGLTPGIDPDATPACSAACIAQAIQFGDFNDPTSIVSQQVHDGPSFQMHEELGTDPQIKYLYSTPAVPGRDGATSGQADDGAGDPHSPLLGKQQVFWDWRAAMNWICGGVSSGFLVSFWFLSLGGDISPPLHAWVNFAGGCLMAVGLAFVFWKIGRKERFWRAIARPQTSWMTRELYAVAVFGAAVLIGLVWHHLLVFAIAGFGAAAFLICQAMILWRARGIPAWRHPVVPALVVASGLLEGIGLLSLGLFVANLAGYTVAGSAATGLGLIGVCAAFACFVLWRAYEATARQYGVGVRAHGVLQEVGRTLGPAGQLAPAVLFMLAYVMSNTTGGISAAAVAGVLAIAGGAYWKFMVITRAGHHQGFAMAKLPQRGSGTRAAPARLDKTKIPT